MGPERYRAFNCAFCRRNQLFTARACDGATPPRRVEGAPVFEPTGWWALQEEWAHRTDLGTEESECPPPQPHCWVLDVRPLHYMWLQRFAEAQDGFAPPTSEWPPFWRRVYGMLKSEKAAQWDAQQRYAEEQREKNRGRR